MRLSPPLRHGLWLLALCCGFTHAASETPAVYRFEAVPAWVQPIEPELKPANPPDDLSDGTWYLLLDRQIDVTAAGSDSYQRVALKVVNAAGVESQSQVVLSVDPSFQTLAIHALRVVRDGVAIDQRKLARITALPSESEIERHIYDGGYNVDIVLSDVRVGDVIDYAYTLRSKEQLFPGHFSREMDVAWSNPMHRQSVRLRYPADRAMRYRFDGAGVQPVTLADATHRELRFDWRDLTPIQGDSDRPGWSSPWPTLEFSDLPDWGAVAQRVTPLFALDDRPRPRLDSLVQTLRSGPGSPEQKALRALQFVQEKIRYTSISIGRGGYVPTDPELLLERHFGDCKDKSLLLATVLNRLGIEAEPALVHSRRGRLLGAALPTPYKFDHAITRVRMGAAAYWLDGTLYKQYSPLAKLDPADFDMALPIALATRGLASIPRPLPAGGGRELTMAFDLSKGLLEPALLDVTTRYRGADADSMRDNASRQSVTERQAAYLNYYAGLYPGIQVAQPFSLNDDRANNVLVLKEHYKLDKTFAKTDKGELGFSVTPDEIMRYGRNLPTSVRTAPLAIGYPDRVRQTMTVVLPEDWEVTPAKREIRDKAFLYRSEVSRAGRIVTLDYRYEALKDHVTPAELSGYVANRSALYDDAGMYFTKPAGTAATPAAGAAPASLAIAPAPFFANVLVLALAGWLCWRWLYRYDPVAPPAPEGEEAGISGWLGIAAIGVVLRPGILIYTFTQFVRFVDASVWANLPTVVSADYAAWVQPVVLAIMSGYSVLLALSITVAVLFFRRRSSVPRLYVIGYWLTVGLSAFALGFYDLSGLAALESKDKVELAREAFWALIWTAYMVRSKRVKATFTRRFGEVPVEVAKPAAPALPPRFVEEGAQPVRSADASPNALAT